MEEDISNVYMALKLCGKRAPGERLLHGYCDDKPFLVISWVDGFILNSHRVPLNLDDPNHASVAADAPLSFLLKLIPAIKGQKEPEMGATVSLLPLVLGEKEIIQKVPLIYTETGELTEFSVIVKVVTDQEMDERTLLTVTMMRAHCLPPVQKDALLYLAALGLKNKNDSTINVQFGPSLALPTSTKTVYNTSGMGCAASSCNIPDEDVYVPSHFQPSTTPECTSAYWYVTKRILIDKEVLCSQLKSPIYLEMAGIPKSGKRDLKARFLTFLDASILLEPGQQGLTVCSNLQYFSEAILPDVGCLLDFPPTSAKGLKPEGLIFDEFEHSAYCVVRFDLIEPLFPTRDILLDFQTLSLQPDLSKSLTNELYVDPLPEDLTVDVRKIRSESGALAVHNELSSLASRCVPMNESIKRTAANKLLLRVKTMLKQFSKDKCSEHDFKDIVTGQHAATRSAVTASFTPQAPPLRPLPKSAYSRARMAGDKYLAERHVESALLYHGKNPHPQPLLSKSLRLLEDRKDTSARVYLFRALTAQTRNRYLLWAYAAQEYDKGKTSYEKALSALRIAVKGDYADTVANVIGWAALLVVYKYGGNNKLAFIAGKKMRKIFELPIDWEGFLKSWEDTSGQEEFLWYPSYINPISPLVIAAAFFLCLRGYNLSDLLLDYFVAGLGVRGSRIDMKDEVCPDIYYIRVASLMLREHHVKALELVDSGIQEFGPLDILCQLRVVVLVCGNNADFDFERPLSQAESFGIEMSPFLLLMSALKTMRRDPKMALQRAARAHNIMPCAYTALAIGRIYLLMGDEGKSERWASAAVKLEPLLADGWAFLAIMAIYARNLPQARSLLRTSRQAGELSFEIAEELVTAIEKVPTDGLPEALMKDVCMCLCTNY